MEIAAFVPKSATCWQGRTSAQVFGAGCSVGCRYCFAHAILDARRVPLLDAEEVLDSLVRSRDEVDAVTITGGEPLDQGAALFDFAARLKGEGFSVKLDTAGTDSFLLQKLLRYRVVDYVALDLKNQLNEYSYFKVTGRRVNMNHVIRSLQLVTAFAPAYELTFTYVPRLHSANDALVLSRQLSGARRFVLQSFTSAEGTRDSALESSRDSSHDMLLRLAKQVRNIDEVWIRTQKGTEAINPHEFVRNRDLRVPQ